LASFDTPAAITPRHYATVIGHYAIDYERQHIASFRHCRWLAAYADIAAILADAAAFHIHKGCHWYCMASQDWYNIAAYMPWWLATMLIGHYDFWLATLFSAFRHDIAGDDDDTDIIVLIRIGHYATRYATLHDAIADTPPAADDAAIAICRLLITCIDTHY